MADPNVDIHTMNPRELIDWCNMRCKEKGVSRAKLADVTGVPESTLDRILSGKNPEFRYSTIQPILSYLIEYKKETPQPDVKDEAQPEYYFNTIEGYKLILDNKNHMIEEYLAIIKRFEGQVDFLRSENKSKDETIKAFRDHLKWMEEKFDEK